MRQYRGAVRAQLLRLRLRRRAVRQLRPPRAGQFRRDRADRRGQGGARANLRAGRVPARHPEGRCLSLGQIPASGRPAQQLRYAAPAQARASVRAKRAFLLKAHGPAHQGRGHRVRPAGPPGRMLRLRRHLLGVRGSRLHQDGLRQGRRSRAGRPRVPRLGRQLVPDASARLRRAHRRSDEVYPHRPDPERSQRMSTARERTDDTDAMLHPELRAEDDPHAIIRSGHRLDHAEGASKPLQPKQPEKQPRGATIHGARPVDQAEAAARFIAAPEHEKMHDERLWDLRQKRDREMHGIPEWEELRALASAIKEHTLTRLDQYLEQFEANARSNGITVHWARDAAEHNRIVHGILNDHGAKSLIKSKSMLTEECGFRAYMASVGIEVIETDLGERIQQLDNEDPSHVGVPAVHKLRTDVAEVFSKTLGTDPDNSDVHYLAETQREATRPLILKADAGMTGANFVVAQTGTFVVCTNEGNADLSANVPKLHIASIGIEKVIPRLEHLGVFVRLLSRSALGSPMTQYTSHFRGPRVSGEMHIVLVDKSRSERLGLKQFWTSLKCIRCGACMNTCPVYRRSGGLSYGATYSGPIGLIIDPTFNPPKYSNLPFASSLNGSCTNVCPVKINIHEQIYAWRRVLVKQHEVPLAKKAAMKAAGVLLSQPAAYRAAIAAADTALAHLPRFVIYNGLNAWGKHREVPHPPEQTFHRWHRPNRGAKR